MSRTSNRVQTLITNTKTVGMFPIKGEDGKTYRLPSDQKNKPHTGRYTLEEITHSVFLISLVCLCLSQSADTLHVWPGGWPWSWESYSRDCICNVR